MRWFYEWVGRRVVGSVRLRFGRQLRIGGVVAIVAILVGGYLAASRRVEEG